MPKQTKDITEQDARLAKAMSHPLRMRILIEFTKDVRSPSSLATQLGEPLENVAHHVKVLRRLDCVELVRAERRRGTDEHFYRATVRPFVSSEASEELSESVRAAMSATTLQHAFSAAQDATAAQTLDARVDRHLSLTRLTLTEKGWGRLNVLLDDLLATAIELHAQALNGQEEPEDLMTSELLLAHFPAAPSSTNAAARTPS